MVKKLLAAILPASTVLAIFASATPAQAALPDCVGGGGRIVNAGTATFSDCKVTGNTVSGSGGAVNNTGTLTLTNVLIDGNSAISGGGIWNSGTLTLNNATITGNTSSDDGGGIYNSGAGSLTINGATIGGTTPAAGNSASSGGGIFNSGTINSSSTNVNILGNTAAEDGGGIQTENSLSITGGTLSGNKATNNGGGAWNNDFMELIGFKISSNTAQYGGGIYGHGGTFLAQDTIGDGNHAASDGGGIWSDQFLRMIQTSVQNNSSAARGGGLYGQHNTVDLNSDTISGNTAATDGGGIYETSGLIEGTDLSLHGSVAGSRAAQPRGPAIVPAPNLTISGNTASGNGGGVALTNADSGSGSLGLLNATIADNKATGNSATGGGVWLDSGGGSLLIKATLLARNLPHNCQDSGSGQISEPGTPNSANLDTGNTCELNTGTNSSDKINVADPKLDVLADNFGFTKTQALLFGSPAIDSVPTAAGCPPNPATDERGTTRPQAANCDIGAYECIGATPAISQVSPNTGPIVGGTKITITGTGFDRPAAVTIGGAAATSVVVVSPTQITATSPPGTGSAAVVVQTCRAANPSGAVFAYQAPVLPAAGALRPDPSLTWAWLLVLLVIGAPAAGLLVYAYRPERRA